MPKNAQQEWALSLLRVLDHQGCTLQKLLGILEQKREDDLMEALFVNGVEADVDVLMLVEYLKSICYFIQ
jgi:hypothetical protein